MAKHVRRHPKKRRTTEPKASKDGDPLDAHRAALVRSATLDQAELTFNDDIGALHAVHQMVMDAVDGDAHWKFIAPLAKRSLALLEEQQQARKYPGWTPGLGGERPLPDTVWGSLRELAAAPHRPSKEMKASINGHGFNLFMHAEAIRRADSSWRTWEHHRSSLREDSWVPPPDPAWKYPLSRALYLGTWGLHSEVHLLEEEVSSAKHKRLLSRLWYRTPDVRADEASWRRSLVERWNYQVNGAYSIKFDYQVLDDYHTRLAMTWKVLQDLRDATTAAAPELDAGEPSPLNRFTTRFTGLLDRVQDALPSPTHDGRGLANDATERAALLQERIGGLAELVHTLRSLAYQKSSLTSSTSFQASSGGIERQTHDLWRWPTGALLASDAEINLQTFRRIRKKAGLDRGERGAKARLRTYPPEEVAALIDAALRHQVQRSREISEAWRPHA